MSYFECMSTSTVSTENDIDQETVTSRLNDNGRIVIPADMRHRMGIKPGDTVFLTFGSETAAMVQTALGNVQFATVAGVDPSGGSSSIIVP